MEGICKERRQSIALLKQTLAVLQENFIVLKLVVLYYVLYHVCNGDNLPQDVH